jgi:hypothetical protein
VIVNVSTSDAYQAVLVVSFGGPEGRDEVIPFLENVLRGRNVPRERLLEVAKHSDHFGGVSPINAQNRALIAALEAELQQNGPDLPVYFGNRNWRPFLADALRQMRDDGIRRALGFFTSAFISYSGWRLIYFERSSVSLDIWNRISKTPWRHLREFPPKEIAETLRALFSPPTAFRRRWRRAAIMNCNCATLVASWPTLLAKGSGNSLTKAAVEHRRNRG